MFKPYLRGRTHGYIVYTQERAIEIKQCLTHIQRKKHFSHTYCTCAIVVSDIHEV